MKLKEKKRKKREIPFDPVLFAATMPSRKPTAKDKADARERADDAFMLDHDTVVSFSIGPHSMVSK